MYQKKATVDTYRGLRKWMEYALVRGLLTVVEHLPLKVAYRVGTLLGLLVRNVLRSRLKVVENNLKIVKTWMVKSDLAPSKELDTNFIKRDAREVFERSFGALVSSFSLGNLSLKRQREQIRLEGIEHFSTAVSKKKGIILLLAHIGPWEGLTTFASLLKNYGYEIDFGAMYRPLNNVYLDSWYLKKRESRGNTLFSRRDDTRKIIKFLKSGGVFAFFADQRTSGGELSNFFGVPALTTPILRTLSRHSGAPVLSMGLYYDLSCNLTLKFRTISIENAISRKDFADITNCAMQDILTEDVTGALWLHKRFVN